MTSNQSSVPPTLIDGAEVQRRFGGIHRITVVRWCRDGLLTPIIGPFGKHWYSECEVERLVRKRQNFRASS